MKITGKIINTEMARIHKSVANNLNNMHLFSSVKKDTADTSTELKTPVTMETAVYVFENSSYVAKSCRILAKDIILNDITLTIDNDVEDAEADTVVQKITDYLLENQTELYNLAVDYYYAGWGAIEYAYDSTRFTLRQIPIYTCKVVQVRIGKEDYYLLRQKVNTEVHYFKIMGENYPIDFTTYEGKELKDCAILGGDNFYEFFSLPLWVNESDKIFTEIAISKKNYSTISTGNIASGVLNINLEPQLKAPVQYDENGDAVKVQSREEVISEELAEANGGTAVLFTESNRPVTLDYIKLENNNYDYLNTIQEKAEQSVLNCYGIPLTRLMINTEKESMNSNKTQSIWEIYTLDLKNEQKKFKDFIKELIYDLYKIRVDVEMSVPIFSDKRETEVGLLIEQWNNGLLTLKQTIIGLSQYNDIINLNDYDFTVNTSLWDYRKLDSYYQSLDSASEEELAQIEEIIKTIE